MNRRPRETLKAPTLGEVSRRKICLNQIFMQTPKGRDSWMSRVDTEVAKIRYAQIRMGFSFQSDPPCETRTWREHSRRSALAREGLRPTAPRRSDLGPEGFWSLDYRLGLHRSRADALLRLHRKRQNRRAPAR